MSLHSSKGSCRRLLQSNRALSALANVEETLETAENEENSIDDDGREDGASHSIAVLRIRIINAAGELLMARFVQSGDRAQDHNGEYRDNNT